MIMLQPRQRSAIKGQIFGARGDSCSCDPCDCNPCKCGDSLQPNYPDWRVSGYYLRGGIVDQQQFSKHILLSLAQPTRPDSYEDWQEVLLVQNDTPLKLVETLLHLFEHELESMPAELGPQPQVKRAVYRASMDYHITGQGPWLRVTFQPTSDNQIRVAAWSQQPQAWIYDGPMALRGNFSLATE